MIAMRRSSIPDPSINIKLIGQDPMPKKKEIFRVDNESPTRARFTRHTIASSSQDSHPCLGTAYRCYSRDSSKWNIEGLKNVRFQVSTAPSNKSPRVRRYSSQENILSNKQLLFRNSKTKLKKIIQGVYYDQDDQMEYLKNDSEFKDMPKYMSNDEIIYDYLGGSEGFLPRPVAQGDSHESLVLKSNQIKVEESKAYYRTLGREVKEMVENNYDELKKVSQTIGEYIYDRNQLLLGTKKLAQGDANVETLVKMKGPTEQDSKLRSSYNKLKSKLIKRDLKECKGKREREAILILKKQIPKSKRQIRIAQVRQNLQQIRRPILLTPPREQKLQYRQSQTMDYELNRKVSLLKLPFQVLWKYGCRVIYRYGQKVEICEENSKQAIQCENSKFRDIILNLP